MESRAKDQDFLTHLELYLARRDGVDKLLKISRYAAKIILSSPAGAAASPAARHRLKSFESSLGLSRKAFRLGKFVQDVNALRSYPARLSPLALLAYGGEGLYYFLDQLLWLSKSGLIHLPRSAQLQKISAWAELLGYLGSIGLKMRDLGIIIREEDKLRSKLHHHPLMTDSSKAHWEKLKKVVTKRRMKELSMVQDIADGLMAFADVRDGKGVLTSPLLLASAGMLSALISTHKNWASC